MVHIRRINEMANSNSRTCILESNTKDIDLLWAVAVCTSNDNEYNALAELSHNTNGIMSFAFDGEWANGNVNIECFGKTLDYKAFRRMFNDDLKGSKRLHRYTMKNPVGDIYDSHIYIGNTRDGMIQLSDRYMLDGIMRPYVQQEWESIRNAVFKAFEKKYDTKLYMLGGGGRHLCVENTLENRIHFLKMLNDIDIAVDKIIELYNNHK